MTRHTTPTLTCDDAHTEDESPAGVPVRRSGLSRPMVALIHAYQGARAGKPTGCRYLPSCSEYAVEAIDRHGPARGTVLAARRIARCTPWGGHGIDPVPDRRAP